MKEIPALYWAEVATESGALNIRDAPGLAGDVIGKAPRGSAVCVLGEEAFGWQRVRAGGIEGYASAQYLTRVEEGVWPGEEEKPETEGGAQVTLIDDEGRSWHPQGGWRVLFGSID